MAGHGGGGAGMQNTGAINVNSGGDPNAVLDPTPQLSGQSGGINQLVALSRTRRARCCCSTPSWHIRRSISTHAEEDAMAKGKLVDTTGRYLTVVRPDPDGAPDEGIPPKDADDVIGQIVMHAATAWVVACMERDAHTVDVARIAPGLFDAMVHLVGGGEVMVRVHTQLDTGPRLTLTVEPVHP
jgi:hypothetical protein